MSYRPLSKNSVEWYVVPAARSTQFSCHFDLLFFVENAGVFVPEYRMTSLRAGHTKSANSQPHVASLRY
jgi:hypothetical protein